MTFHGDKVRITEGWMKWGRISGYQKKEGSFSLPLLMLMENRLTEPAGKVKHLLNCQMVKVTSKTVCSIFVWQLELLSFGGEYVIFNEVFFFVLYICPCLSVLQLTQLWALAVVINNCVTRDYRSVYTAWELTLFRVWKIYKWWKLLARHGSLSSTHGAGAPLNLSQCFNIIWDESL